MALSVTNVGGHAESTAVATATYAPQANIPAGSLGVLLVAFSNSGGGGASCSPVASFTDSAGNTWTRRDTANYDPGTVNNGATNAVYTGAIQTQVSTSGNIPYGSSTAAVSTCRLYYVTGAAGAAYNNAGSGTGATNTTPSVTTASITNGNAVFGFANYRLDSNPTAWDTDTSNGSWDAGSRTGASQPRSCSAQYKIVTGTATQTFNLTIASSVAHLESWLEVKEKVPTETDGSASGSTSAAQMDGARVLSGDGSSSGTTGGSTATANVLLTAGNVAGSTTSAQMDSVVVLSGAGSSDGVATAAADGEDAGTGGITETEGTAAGAASDSVVGAAIDQTDGSAAGTTAGSVAGAAIDQTTGSVTGAASDSVIGAAIDQTTGSMAGVSTCSAESSATAQADAAAAGTTAGSVVGAATDQTTGSAAGTTSDSVASAEIISAVGGVAGSTTTDGQLAATFAGVYGSTGTSSVAGAGENIGSEPDIQEADGVAAGAATTSFDSATISVQSADGASSAAATADALTAAMIATLGVLSGAASASAVSGRLAQLIASSAGLSIVAAEGDNIGLPPPEPPAAPRPRKDRMAVRGRAPLSYRIVSDGFPP
jgi:hypothetical protein